MLTGEANKGLKNLSKPGKIRKTYYVATRVYLSTRVHPGFLARFLIRFLARVLTRVLGRGKTINTMYSTTRPKEKRNKTSKDVKFNPSNSLTAY